MISLLKIGSFPWQTFNLLDGKKVMKNRRFTRGFGWECRRQKWPHGAGHRPRPCTIVRDNVYGRWVSDGLFFTFHSHFRSLMFWSLMHLMSGEFLVTYWCVISSDQQVMGRSQWRNCCRLHNYAPITQPPVLRPGFFQPCQHFFQMWHCQKGWTNR